MQTYEFLERAAIFFLRIAEQSFTRILVLSSYGISVGLATGDVNKKEVGRKKIGNMRIRTHGEQAAES